MAKEMNTKLTNSSFQQEHILKKGVLFQIIFLFTGLMAIEVAADMKLPISEEYQALNQVVIDKKITNEEKIKQIETYFADDPRSNKALQWIGRVDKELAAELMKKEFRNKNRSVSDRIELGELLLSPNRYYTPDFGKEYAPFLIEEILSSGTKTFNTKLDEHTKTAIGQYAYIASGFMGYSSEHFEFISDKRVIPVLIKAMDAPDKVYGEQLGCCIRGKPGESTKRNVERQQIPVALARLGAKEAIKPLRKVLTKHHDPCLRDNAAYALGVLLPPKKRQPVITQLKESKDHFCHLFEFGKGMIHIGDDAGVEYMNFKYSYYYKEKDLASIIYMVEQRINIVKQLRSDKLEEFYRQAFKYKLFYNVLLFDESKVKANDYGHTEYNLEKAGKRINDIYDKMLTSIEINQLENLAPIIKDIAKRTSDTGIRKRSEQSIKTIKEKS